LQPTLEAAQSVLRPIAEAKEQSGVKDEQKIKLYADRGYFSRSDLKNCEDSGFLTYVPAPVHRTESAGFYSKSSFIFNKHDNTYTCPAGEILTKHQLKKRKGMFITEYKNAKACQGCALKSRCTKAKARHVSRWEHEECLEQNRQRLEDEPDAMKTRGSLVEHPFGTIKDYILNGGFLVRGKEKVQAELSMAQLCYNLKRVLNIVNFQELMAI
jgi:hypothetical protein